MLVLMAIEDMQTDLGCTDITIAGTLDKALELVATQSFDLATVDVNLNGERSYPVANALKAAGVPFAFSTGYGEHGLGEDYAGHPTLNKPYNCDQLNKVLTVLLSPHDPPALAA